MKDSLKNRSDLTCTLRACSILRSETKRNEIKYMGEGEKMLINLNTEKNDDDLITGGPDVVCVTE